MVVEWRGATVEQPDLVLFLHKRNERGAKHFEPLIRFFKRWPNLIGILSDFRDGRFLPLLAACGRRAIQAFFCSFTRFSDVVLVIRV